MIIDKKNREEQYKDRKYEVVSYNVEWPQQFETYALQIRNIFGDVQIDHIGSTSVPGMSGKDCIDVLVVVKDLRVVEQHIEDMKKNGFEYAGQFVMEGSRLFRVIKSDRLLANIHFFLERHSHITEMLNLRNYLCKHKEEVVAYSNLKGKLYSKYADDYGLYRKYKDEYMDELKKRVLEE